MSDIINQSEMEMNTEVEENLSAEVDQAVEAEVEEANGEEENAISLLSLSWDDILFSNLLPYLRWNDLFRLRSTSVVCQQLVDGYFKQLKYINLISVHSKFTGDAFEVVAAQCTNLRKLVINKTLSITDNHLAIVFRDNPLISFLDLSECKRLNGTCLLSLAVHCKKLQTLILRHCNWLTHGALETLIEHLDSMEVVDLSSCPRVCNETLLPLVQRFQKLQELRIASVQSVNDTTMLAIGRSCGDSLKILDVKECQNITDKGIKMIDEYCKNLKTLHVRGARFVTEHSLETLRMRGVDIDREKGEVCRPLFPYLQV